jgi:hypothetical protein
MITNIHDQFDTHLALDILYDDSWSLVVLQICEAIPNSELDIADDDIRVVAQLDPDTLVMFCDADEVNDHRYYVIESINSGEVLAAGKFQGYRSAMFLYENNFEI